MSAPVHNPALVPPGISGPAEAAPARAGATVARERFAQLLDARRIGVQFSNHAVQRLERRGIAVEPGTLQRLDDAVGRAAGKGARDAVVFVDGTAFVVSVRNKTVITAVDRDHMRDHVFTNIDSAVIA
ncbi:MAG TPA: TIGR02530 family flagellar biosynthesis protein [Solirubrobacteraceae bacterium]|nr:TIGR02530 family flagellar biosynthesis protein [Solirubrobacteraceae bacterium]